MKKNQRPHQFNIVLTPEEHETVALLRNKYAINISKAFRLLLKQYREQLEKSNVNLNIQN